MRIRRLEHGYILRIEKGEELHEMLRRFVIDERVQGGSLHAIGAAEKAVLGRYDLREHVYHNTTLEGELEVGSLTGTIAWLADKPAIHIHAVIADEQLHAFTGHLHELRVNPMLEVVVSETYRRLTRAFDAKCGLNLLDI